MKTLLASLALLTLSLSRADAAVIVTLPTASTSGSIQITNDINFTVTTAGYIGFMIFDEWVTFDGDRTIMAGSNISPSSLSFSLNGGGTLFAAFDSNLSFRDNNGSTLGNLTPNDGGLRFQGIGVAVNDIVTIKAATYTLAAGSLPTGFNPQTNQTFTGNAFLMNSSGLSLTANTSVNAVPEPSRALLLMGGLGSLFFRRRRLA